MEVVGYGSVSVSVSVLGKGRGGGGDEIVDSGRVRMGGVSMS